jgi:hypothetical protein
VIESVGRTSPPGTPDVDSDDRRSDGVAVPWFIVIPLAYAATGWGATSAAFSRSTAFATPLFQLSAMACDAGLGNMSSSPFSIPSKIPRATDSGGLRDVYSAGHVGVRRAREDGLDAHTLPRQQHPQRLGQVEHCSLRDRVGRGGRERGDRLGDRRARTVDLRGLGTSPLQLRRVGEDRRTQLLARQPCPVTRMPTPDAAARRGP